MRKNQTPDLIFREEDAILAETNRKNKHKIEVFLAIQRPCNLEPRSGLSDQRGLPKSALAFGLLFH